jgi:hypothetical protein
LPQREYFQGIGGDIAGLGGALSEEAHQNLDATRSHNRLLKDGNEIQQNRLQKYSLDASYSSTFNGNMFSLFWVFIFV